MSLRIRIAIVTTSKDRYEASAPGQSVEFVLVVYLDLAAEGFKRLVIMFRVRLVVMV